MKGLELRLSGRFEEAITVYEKELKMKPDDIELIDGLAGSYMYAGRYTDAIPLMLRVEEYQKKQIPDHPGQQLEIAICYWCLDCKEEAKDVVFDLCKSNLNGSVGMVPDGAGGAVFGLILNYMSLDLNDVDAQNYAVSYLKKLNQKYIKDPNRFRFPAITVKQALGKVTFFDVLISIFDEHHEITGSMLKRSIFERIFYKNDSDLLLKKLTLLAQSDISLNYKLGIALFYDGVSSIHCPLSDKFICRMKDVFALGYKTDFLHWFMARKILNIYN